MKIRQTLIVSVLGFIGIFYLLNPTAGIFELLPDNLPLLGNLDEAVATAFVIAALRYFGIDLTKGFQKKSKEVTPRKN